MNRLAKSFTFLGLLFLVNVLINACSKCGEGSVCSYVRYKEPNVSNKNIKLTSSSTTEAKDDTLHLLVDFAPEYYTYMDWPDFDLFFTSAYACTPCTQGDLGSKDTVTRFEILSDQDFDDAHKKGTSLNDLFLVSRYDKNSASMVNDSLHSFLVYFIIENRAPLAPFTWPIHLSKKPTSVKEHRLRFEIDYADGRKYVTDAGSFVFP
jgi:hypothetical protein